MSLRHRIAGRFPRLVIARRNISRAKVRSILAAASILIGVVAIGAIGAGGAAFKQSQLQSIQAQGATSVYVSPGADMEASHFDREDVKAIDETVGAAAVVATEPGSMELITSDGTRDGVSVTYIDDPRQLHEVERGGIPDNWRQSVVVSHEFAADRGVELGERLKLVSETETASGTVETEHTYRVVAVLAESQSFGGGGLFLPIEETGDRQYSRVEVMTESTDRAEAVAEALRDRFNDRKDRLLVFELTSLVRLLKTLVNGINAFLAGLGSISLLVAGVSIANTMLMAVIKRREEIGVLRAVGYGKVDIVRILLVEAVLLGTLGSAVGLAIAVVVAMVANALFLGDPFAFTQSALLYLAGAVGFGILTSLLAGAYPAWRAANERPIDALRG
ncbi:ABC-type transport system permease protein (probable substrate macrolides) (plasmid) [Haloferax gibbonsii]|uniref:ABC-type transport system permease protein (Probable substrate macrolides) n=1 Tax=Haloferax gibbonsii TaxID=35746 RepID=A0A871BLT8_HALGI|nr:ABC transporter permease [Haloferax gibbonsii]QOS13704.1 ABC-type transport system permease protein (probable substrate macrolides) [Haloferax gibbonsii]